MTRSPALWCHRLRQLPRENAPGTGNYSQFLRFPSLAAEFCTCCSFCLDIHPPFLPTLSFSHRSDLTLPTTPYGTPEDKVRLLSSVILEDPVFTSWLAFPRCVAMAYGLLQQTVSYLKAFICQPRLQKLASLFRAIFFFTYYLFTNFVETGYQFN